MHKFLTFVATLALALTLLDRLLPPDRMDTTVHIGTFTAASGGEIVYNVPLTGGGIASCDVSEDTVRQSPAQSEIVVATSAIFGRCTGITPYQEPRGIDRAAFIVNAIRYAYNNVYANLDELRQDYPGFTPSIRLWGDDPWYQPTSARRYSVQLPKELVILDPSGAARTIRACGSTGGYCKAVKPRSAEKNQSL